MPKKLIIFFAPSNNELKYLKTKHNIGRIFLEGLSARLGVGFEKSKNFYLAEYKGVVFDVHFVYNDGYMNLAGESIFAYFNYKNPSQKYSEIELCICHDDSDIISGNAKLTLGGSSGGHKGVDSSYRLLANKSNSTENGSKTGQAKIAQQVYQNNLSSLKIETKRLKSGDKSKIQNLSWPPMRLKIGIRPIENKLKSETFVLKPISQSDEKTAEKLATLFASKISQNQDLDWQKLQNLVNVKNIGL